jgi:predicted nuclease of restriction endonuclease-like (RecB) superfamily
MTTRRAHRSSSKKPPVVPGALRPAGTEPLFDRIVSILEEARGRSVRAVNTQIVTAYWLIGKELVEALQGGNPRAKYGARVLDDLSHRLTARYRNGYSTTNLRYFRLFYLAFPDRGPAIRHPSGDESSTAIRAQAEPPAERGFHAALSWSHYRALMRVQKPAARNFYEHEAVACRWSKTQLERQIETFHYDRLLMGRGKKAAAGGTRKDVSALQPVDALKDPYVLEFLDLPTDPALHESELEAAIIANLQNFLLELGKGFSFVARQKRMRFEDDDFYVDLVFYNYLLRCFVLIDLKVGKLTHQDIGQMDSYVRMFEAHEKMPGHNPTIGLILCSKKNEAVARYSVLHGSRQLFAARYLTYLPTEEELRRELQRERQLIETALNLPTPRPATGTRR